MAGHGRRSCPHESPMSTLLVLGLCLLLAAASTLSQAARLLNSEPSLPHQDSYLMRPRYDHASAGASDGMMKQTSVAHHDMHVHKFVGVVARELVSAATSPPAVNVAHTDYICADSC